MIVLDTSAIVALADKRDSGHGFAVEMSREHGPHLIIPCWLTAEATYMLGVRAGSAAVGKFLNSCIAGELLVEHTQEDLERSLELTERYSDLPLDFVDASVIACALRNRAPVLTLDRRDFSVVAKEGNLNLAE